LYLDDKTLIEGIGLLGLMINLCWPLFRERNHIFSVQGVSSTFFATHYYLVDAYTAAALSLFVIPQVIVASLRPTRHWRWGRWLFIALAPCVLALVALSWQGWWSAFVGMGVLFAMFARSRHDTLMMRLCFFPATTCWAIHNYAVGSTAGMIADAASLTMNLIGIWRVWSERRLEQAEDVVDGAPMLRAA
jgi:hypothetical protein